MPTREPTVEELLPKQITVAHRMVPVTTPEPGYCCRECGHHWPCDAIRAATALRKALADNERLRTALAAAEAETEELDAEIAKCREIVCATSEELHVDLERLVESAEDAERFEWWFSNQSKVASVNEYIMGVQAGWSTDQWRAWIDTQLAARTHARGEGHGEE